jgi:hypothetical protein
VDRDARRLQAREVFILRELRDMPAKLLLAGEQIELLAMLRMNLGGSASAVLGSSAAGSISNVSMTVT